MKKCKVCGTDVDDKYDYCMKCINKVKETNIAQEIAKSLVQINWNLGSINLTQKLGLLNKLETLKCRRGLTEIQQNIHQLLLDKAEKDLKNVSKIEGELKDV